MKNLIKSKKKVNMKVIVVESYNDFNVVEWGVSFTDYNPLEKDYVACKSKEDAFKLKDILDK